VRAPSPAWSAFALALVASCGGGDNALPGVALVPGSAGGMGGAGGAGGLGGRAPGGDPCAGLTARGTTRFFAVQPRVEATHFATYEAFRGHVRRLVDEGVAPHLPAAGPAVVALPENFGLPAAFVGSRGEAARAEGQSLLAFAALQQAYAGPIAHYTKTWPDLTFQEQILLGVTDTVWRAFFEAVRDVARSTGAFVIASAVASGDVEASRDPADVAALRDPDLPEVAEVYVARDRRVYNTAYVVSPAGEVVARARKPYLVPSEEGELTLTPGAIDGPRLVEICGLKVGIVTSKDAWMPDVVDRLALAGADLLVQPEAFSGWAIEEVPGDWLPDVFRQSAWAATQKHASLRGAVVPHLVGNFFDLVFDGQSAVIGDAAPGRLGVGYVGQPPQGGFLATLPWADADPGEGDASLPLAARRTALRAFGETLRPGGARAGQYREGVAFADLEPRAPFAVEPPGPPGALGPSAPIAGDATAEQTQPATAGDGAGRIAVVYGESPAGAGGARLRLAVSSDGGVTFRALAPLAPAAAGDPIAPALAYGAAGLYLAWQERDASGAYRVYVALSTDHGASFSAPVRVGAEGSGEEWAPALALGPAGVLVAFVSTVAQNERVYVARAAPGTIAFGAALPADPAAPVEPAGAARNNQWAPDVAAGAGGEAAVAWVDFRRANWDVFVARSSDGGASFAPAERADDGTDAPERLHDDPSLAYAGGALAGAWTDVRLRQAPARPRVARLPGPSAPLGSAPPEASGYRPRLATLGDGRVIAAWQDFRTLGNDVYLAASADGGATFGPEARVDDGGEGPSYQFAPRPADAGAGRVVVVWEDTRSGRRQVRYAAGAL
jgi:predicted amidohydrolase